jgi:hypothetical protein
MATLHSLVLATTTGIARGQGHGLRSVFVYLVFFVVNPPADCSMCTADVPEFAHEIHEVHEKGIAHGTHGTPEKGAFRHRISRLYLRPSAKSAVKLRGLTTVVKASNTTHVDPCRQIPRH